MQDENIYANALLWIVKNVCPQLQEGIAEVNGCRLKLQLRSDTCLARQTQAKECLLQALFQIKGRQTGLLSQYTDRVISSDNEKNHSDGEATTGQ